MTNATRSNAATTQGEADRWAPIVSSRGRAPSLGEIAAETRTPGEEIERLLTALLNPYPLHGSGCGDEDETLDGLEDPNASDPLQATLSRETHEGVAAALNRLSPRERAIVDLRFGLSRFFALRRSARSRGPGPLPLRRPGGRPSPRAR